MATVLAAAVAQGTVTTSSLAVPAGARAVNAFVALTPADRADPALSVGLEVEAYQRLGPVTAWLPASPRVDWQPGGYGGPAASALLPPGATRVRLSIDLSRPASAGAEITFS